MSNPTLEELLKLLDGEVEETSSPVKKKHHRKGDINYRINWFIKDTKLEKGEYKTPNYLLYYVFTRFMGEKKMKIMGKEGFFRGINKRFESKRNGNQRFYMTNLNERIDLNEAYIAKAKRYNELHNEKRKKKSVKKKGS